MEVTQRSVDVSSMTVSSKQRGENLCSDSAIALKMLTTHSWGWGHPPFLKPLRENNSENSS